jgi:hypothetical protein
LDAEVFKRWLTTLLQWFRVNKYVGRAFDSKHIVFTAMYLKGTALMWYDDNIDGINHQEKEWSFKYVVTGLYDRFVHSKAVGEAVNRFWTATYEPEEGVMSFYYRITRYTSRMVWPPDCYTFKMQFMMRLPQGIFEYLLDKEVMAEYSTIENILHHTPQAEKKTWQMTRWHKEQCVNQGVHTDTRRKDVNGMNKSTPKTYPKETSYPATLTAKGKGRASDKGQTKGKPVVTRGNPLNKDSMPSKDVLLSEIKCFHCGQQGHKANDLKYHAEVITSRTKAVQIYAARDIIEEDDHGEDHDCQGKAPVEDDGEEEDEELDEGSQCTSEGEEMEFDTLQSWESSEEELPLVGLHVMNMGWNDSGRNNVLDRIASNSLKNESWGKWRWIHLPQMLKVFHCLWK